MQGASGSGELAQHPGPIQDEGVCYAVYTQIKKIVLSQNQSMIHNSHHIIPCLLCPRRADTLSA